MTTSNPQADRLQAVTDTLTAADATYIQLADFHQGQLVVIRTPAGRQTGIVAVPLRDFSSHVARAFLIVKVYGIRHRVRVMDVLAGKYWVAPILPMSRQPRAAVICQLANRDATP